MGELGSADYYLHGRWAYRSISTAYLAPTNHRGARVRAWAGDDRRRGITLDWDHSAGLEANHIAAVVALVERYGWWGAWTIGGSEPGLVAASAIRYYPPGERADEARRAECRETLARAVDLAQFSQSVVLVLDAETRHEVVRRLDRTRGLAGDLDQPGGAT